MMFWYGFMLDADNSRVHIHVYDILEYKTCKLKTKLSYLDKKKFIVNNHFAACAREALCNK